MNGFIFVLLLLMLPIVIVLSRAILLQVRRPIKELYRRRSSQEDFCPYDCIPERLRFFVIKAEDKRFFSHPGYDINALKAAFKINLREGRIVCGASTITQQLVKNLYFGFELSYFRKITELIISLRVEELLGKDKILELYMNTVYFGCGKYGITDASRFYFGVNPEQLTENQMFMLACIICDPINANFLNHPEAFTLLRDRKLKSMLWLGALSEAEAERLSAYGAPMFDPNLRPYDEDIKHRLRSMKGSVPMRGIYGDGYLIFKVFRYVFCSSVIL